MSPMLRYHYLLFLPNGEPNDPAVFISMIPNWSPGDEITLGGFCESPNRAWSERLRMTSLCRLPENEQHLPHGAR